ARGSAALHGNVTSVDDPVVMTHLHPIRFRHSCSRAPLYPDNVLLSSRSWSELLQDSLLVQQPEDGALDEQGGGERLREVLAWLGGVAEGGAGEEAVVGKIQRDVLQKARRTPAPQRRLDLVVDGLVERGAAPVGIGDAAGPFVEPGARLEQAAPAIELVQ